ncbi:SlyX family protein [Bartonella koehlerae]|uniref:Uncharacterized protein n=1 Tax=Bartonella koehlerae C-29 TaxID=1134510 RepID=A0A067W726_9HYPH|nr:SlyX family protein [Bartonella koehlerae]KEC55790.1 hypothetical protein O9A_00568 [Bartonella koehlerae C-29]
MLDENRLTELEIKSMHQEKFLEEFSCIVTDQWKSLDEIFKKIDILMRRFSDLEEQSFSKNFIASSFRE